VPTRPRENDVPRAGNAKIEAPAGGTNTIPAGPTNVFTDEKSLTTGDKHRSDGADVESLGPNTGDSWFFQAAGGVGGLNQQGNPPRQASSLRSAPRTGVPKAAVVTRPRSGRVAGNL
jgi:hypothetical protein